MQSTRDMIESYERSKDIETRFVAAIGRYIDRAEKLAESGAIDAAIKCHKHIDNYLVPIIDAARSNMVRLSLNGHS